MLEGLCMSPPPDSERNIEREQEPDEPSRGLLPLHKAIQSETVLQGQNGRDGMAATVAWATPQIEEPPRWSRKTLAKQTLPSIIGVVSICSRVNTVPKQSVGGGGSRVSGAGRMPIKV